MTMPGIANGVIAAENDLQMRGLPRSVLTHAGQQEFPAADGQEAVALARQFKARLVLLDVAMPRVNGLQACAMIRRLPGYADVPIVILTGYDEDQFRAAAVRFGAPSSSQNHSARSSCWGGWRLIWTYRRGGFHRCPPRMAAVTPCWVFPRCRGLPGRPRSRRARTMRASTTGGT
jgi:CheY-like chemotaxis protein